MLREYIDDLLPRVARTAHAHTTVRLEQIFSKHRIKADVSAEMAPVADPFVVASVSFLLEPATALRFPDLVNAYIGPVSVALSQYIESQLLAESTAGDSQQIFYNPSLSVDQVDASEFRHSVFSDTLSLRTSMKESADKPGYLQFEVNCLFSVNTSRPLALAI